MELRNILPNQQIAIYINGNVVRTTVENFNKEILDPKKVEAVSQGLQTLDDGLDDTVFLAGVTGHWNGIDTTVDLII